MAKNQPARIKRLEEKTNTGERRRVIPFCCFYTGSDAKTCDCVPYWTREPMVVKKGMTAFYEEVNSLCKPPPPDAELILDYYDEKPSNEKDIQCQTV